MVSTFLPFILLLPLAGFVINGIFGKKLNSERLSGLIGASAVGIGFILSVAIFIELLGLSPDARSVGVNLADWITAGQFSVGFSYLVDPLSVIFLLVITGVGTLIHI